MLNFKGSRKLNKLPFGENTNQLFTFPGMEVTAEAAVSGLPGLHSALQEMLNGLDRPCFYLLSYLSCFPTIIQFRSYSHLPVRWLALETIYAKDLQMGFLK